MMLIGFTSVTTMYVFPVSNRYQVKRTCPTEPMVTDCASPCGPALWESLTDASILLHPRRNQRARARKQVSVWSDCRFLLYTLFVISIHAVGFGLLCLISSFSSLPILSLFFSCRKRSVQPWFYAPAALLSDCMYPSSGLTADPRRD